MTAPSPSPATPPAGTLQIKPAQMFGAVVAFSGLVLGFASFLPFYKMSVFGFTASTVGGWEGFGDTDVWLGGLPAGFLLAATGMVLIVAGALLIWNYKSSYSKVAAIVATVTPFGVWLILIAEAGYVGGKDSSSSNSLSGATASSLHSATGWWVAGFVVWLTLVGGIGALISLYSKKGFGSISQSPAPAGAGGSIPPAAAPAAPVTPVAPPVTSSALPPPSTGQPWTPPPSAPPPSAPRTPPTTDKPGAF